MKRFFILFLLLSYNAFSQKIVTAGRQFNFDAYSTEEGLLQTNISDIFQDSKGYLWVSTNSGVSRFDGISFKNYTEKEGLTEGDCQAFEEDNYGNIWVGATGSVNVIKSNSILKLDTNVGIKRQKFWSMFKDKDGTMWAGSSLGITHLDPSNLKNPVLKFYPCEELKKYGTARCIMRTRSGKLLIGTDIGSYTLRNDSLVREGPGSSTHAISEGKDGKIYYSGWTDAVYVFENGKSVFNINVGIYAVYNMVDSKGNVWIGTFGNGIYKYDGKTVYHYGNKEGLPFNSVWTMCEDKEGNIWIGSWGGGLYKFFGERFSFLSDKSGLPSNNISGIGADKDNNIWISSEAGVSKYDPFSTDLENSITNYTKCDNRNVSKIMCMLIDSKEQIWLPGYGNNGYCLKDGKMTSVPWLGAFNIIEDRKGNIWFGGDGGGIVKYDGKVQKHYYVTQKHANRVYNVFEDSKGIIWGLNNAIGVNILRNDTAINIPKIGYRRKSFTTMIEAKDGTYWLGGEAGLYRCKLKSDYTIDLLDSITTADGLSSNIIESLIFDKSGNLLIGTQNGLCILNGKNYKSGIKSVKAYGKADGYWGGECKERMFLDSSGKVWISTTKGAYCYDPAADKINTIEPNTHITGLDLFFEQPDWSAFSTGFNDQGLPINLSLPYNKNHLTFHFIGISLTAPTKVLYKYMIKGLDTDWSPASPKGEITYSNLPFGSYTFLVKACNSDGVWNSKPTAYDFTIEAPVWRRNWFIALCLLILLGIGYLILRLRERNHVREKKVLEEKVGQRTKELKKAYEEIGEKNKDITDSINYAQRIQQTIFPSEETLEELFKEYFVLYKPKDIVSGDFYWVEKIDDKVYFAVCDCTGHGVPGAFVSLVANNNLSKCVGELGLREPNEILDKLSSLIEESFSKNKNNVNDGMDISLCYWDIKKNQLKFSGANNPIWIIRNNNLLEFKGDKQPVGKHWVRSPFNVHTIDLLKDDRIYLFSDGYADQFGGVKGKKFKYKKLQEQLLQYATLDMNAQQLALNNELESWKGKLEQVDDILIVGIKI